LWVDKELFFGYYPLREGNDIKVNVGLEPQLFAYQGLSRFGK